LALLLLPASFLAPRWSPTGRAAGVTLWTAEGLLWLALLAAAVREPRTLVASVWHTGRNLLAGEGMWGLSLILLGLMVLAALILFRTPHQVFLRFPLTTYLPLVLLLAYLRGGAYRSGESDSLNRMWMHVVPLAVLFVIVAAAHGHRPAATEPGPGPEQSHPGKPERAHEASVPTDSLVRS
jgi:hypothetical protein